jgi:hypothetical protein
VRRGLLPRGEREHDEPGHHDAHRHEVRTAQRRPEHEPGEQHDDDERRRDDGLHDEQRQVVEGEQREEPGDAVDHEPGDDERLRDGREAVRTPRRDGLHDRAHRVQDARGDGGEQGQDHGALLSTVPGATARGAGSGGAAPTPRRNRPITGISVTPSAPAMTSACAAACSAESRTT